MELMKRLEKKSIHFPEGSKNHAFLKQLCKKLEPDFLKESIRKEINMSQADLSESIQQYFKQYLIYTCALKAINSNRLQQNASACDNAELFHLNLLRKYVQNDKPCEKLQLFEKSQILLTRILENKRKSKSTELFTKLVEDNINEICIKFTEYYMETKLPLQDWGKHFDHKIKDLSKRVAILDSADISLNALTPGLQELLLSYYKELAEGIGILEKLLNLYEQKLYCQLNQSKVAADESVFLNLKIQCLELEIMVATYSKSAVNALKIIKEQLDTKIKKSNEEIETVSNKLEEFQVLGTEYDQLVEKYQQLTENIEKQKSTIEYLKADIASKEKFMLK